MYSLNSGKIEKVKNEIIISNGNGKFHLLYTAEKINEEGLLEAFYTSAYPSEKSIKYLLYINKLFNNVRLQRWISRKTEGLKNVKIIRMNLSEIFYQLSNYVQGIINSKSLINILNYLTINIYQIKANRFINNSNAKIYHCRAGYGGKSIKTAQKKGMKVIIDHSAPYPLAYIQLINNQGRYNSEEKVKVPVLWKFVLKDIHNADCVLVNSDFVKKTMIDFGFPENKIKVIYLGIDKDVEKILLNEINKNNSNTIKYLYAGSITKSKGVDNVIRAFTNLGEKNWTLTLAGNISKDMRCIIKKIKDSRIKVLGGILRENLLRIMRYNDVLVFPSLAEGSARVVFEAMAAGMAIITTPQAGSVVENMKHGIIIDPGNEEQLKEAINFFIDNPEKIKEFGENSRITIKENYNSTVYKKKVIELYNSILV
ncbi:glycosyltransferase family 4 protein [Stygiobacter electus]|uniref:Glycosyltransferase family 4 protein n=1 Tax=Stygiobacter electus TaxID=3032292 RepID=A0AAE3TE27_9BACT|nr:glycosyltransferase family 4 protein [Stygiobacter electus]MDF1613096.1 glycosyltransferase family 4 protein [Stygiobacter electus]